jgi:hypothetical protein
LNAAVKLGVFGAIDRGAHDAAAIARALECPPRSTRILLDALTLRADHAETPGNPFWESFARSSAAMAFPAAMALDRILADHLASKPKAKVLDVAVALLQETFPSDPRREIRGG